MRKIFFLLLLIVPGVFACIVPEDDLVVSESAEFCSDVYFLEGGIIIDASNITLDCAGAVLNSVSGKVGISVQNVENVTVKRCRIVHFDYGFLVWNSTRVLLEDNHLIRNNVGASFISSTASATLNHDVSLQRPFDVDKSSNNVFSLTNKRVDGSFCENNFCNSDMNSIERFMLPRTSPGKLKILLEEDIAGKSRTKLKEWVFSFFNQDKV